jgi:flagellar protein FliJ
MDRMELLQTLLEREEKRRDQAVLDWRAAHARAEAQRQQAESLGAYREEYRQRWTNQLRQATNVDLLRGYHLFVERLDQAILLQQGERAASEQRCERAALVLRQRETRVAMVRQLMLRRREAARRQADRREQKAADEISQRLALSARHPATVP